LENAGIELSPTGHIATSGAQQTSNPKIYAAGDVAGPHEIVHVAVEQGAIAARHFLGDSPRPFSYEKLMGVVFTDPQIGIVGLTEVQAQADGFDCVCASFPFDDHGKSITMDAFAGYVKLVADRATGRLLGAECVGKDGGELIHAMTYPVAARVPVKDLLRADWYHPTLSEIWEYPIEDIVDELGL
jgi:pyruvate/2-oxoglutarate dehydrogenase complex dihydrolipoamide dehydrogenase (E3) component